MDDDFGRHTNLSFFFAFSIAFQLLCLPRISCTKGMLISLAQAVLSRRYEKTKLRWGLTPPHPLMVGGCAPHTPLMVGAAPPHPLKVGLWASLMAINDRNSLARKYRNWFVFAQNLFMFLIETKFISKLLGKFHRQN